MLAADSKRPFLQAIVTGATIVLAPGLAKIAQNTLAAALPSIGIAYHAPQLLELVLFTTQGGNQAPGATRARVLWSDAPGLQAHPLLCRPHRRSSSHVPHSRPFPGV